jgi:molecular chaperone GrpE (heat shock protein)
VPTDAIGDEVTLGPQEAGAAALERARAALREVAHERRDAVLQLGAVRKDLGKVVGAAVEAIETLEGMLLACLDQLPTTARASLQAAAESAWQGLEAAGVTRDGAAGEPIDLVRHRVVKEVRGGGKPRVLEVVEPGVLFRGVRLRPAVVVAVLEEGSDGPGRD